MPHAEDPIWDMDWARIERPDLRSQAPVEVFELHGTPTWLARLQSRQEQAGRAGKHKFAQRIGKEMAGAWAAHTASDSSGLTEAADVHEEAADVYGLDWSSAVDSPGSTAR